MKTTCGVVLLHFFGNSRREWALVAERLEPRMPVLAFDLPGFGDAASVELVDVAGMADYIDEQIRSARFGPYVLVGHSMSAKAATVLAARKPDDLRGLILVTGSPPSPEPFSADALELLLSFDSSRAAAEAYVDSLGSRSLPAAEREIAVEDAMRASPIAWKRWVTTASQEDFAERVGVLDLPTCVIAGSDDPSLGPDVQRKLMLPHFVGPSFEIVHGGHALPQENPDALASLIDAFVTRVSSSRGSRPSDDLPGGGATRHGAQASR